MAFGTKQKEAREAAGLTQRDFAARLNLGRSTVGMAEQGRRKMPSEVLGKAVEVIDDGLYAIAVAQEVVGYGWIPMLDGDNVDLHRASVARKTEEELREVLEAIEKICVSNPPNNMQKYEKEKLLYALEEAGEAVVALLHYIAIICREYKISWIGVWKRIYQQFKAKGYSK